MAGALEIRSRLTRLRAGLARVRAAAAVALDTAEAPTAAWLRENRVARLIVLVATAWFVVASAWELFGPTPNGHYASSASVGIIADNMRTWGIGGPVWEYSRTRPTPDQYYCHHPFGIFYTTRILMAIFGRHDFICRLAPVLLSAATPPLLFVLGRALFRPIAGAAAAAAFVVVPIALSFSSFNALEVPVITFTTMLFFGWARLVQTGRARYGAVAIAGAFLATNADWPGFLGAGFVGLLALARLFGGRVLLPRTDDGKMGRFFAVLTVVVAGVGLAYVYAFLSFGKLADLFGAYGFRSQGNQTTLARVLASRRYWIELSFSPIAIVIGKVYVVVALARALVLRRDLELLPLGALFVATVQYVVFRQGADIHVFWPHYFALYFALAFAGLVTTLIDVGGVIARRFEKARRPLCIALAAIATLTVGAILRDGVAALAYARATGGRFNEKGNFIDSDGDKIDFVRWASAHVDPASPLVLDPSFRPNWSVLFAIGRPAQMDASIGRAPRDATAFADVRFLSESDREALLGRYEVTTVGPYWMLRAGPAPRLSAHRFDTREPSPWEWYFLSGNEPVRTVAPDPFGAWEIAAHRGLALPDLPEASTPDQHRIAHNAAVAKGDTVEAERHFAALAAAGKTIDAAFDDGTKISLVLGGRGVDPRLFVLVMPAGPLAAGVKLSVTSQVTEPPAWSTTMADPTVREHAYPFTIGPQRFRAGFLYAAEVAYRRRPGRDTLRASLTGAGAPRLASGEASVVLPME